MNVALPELPDDRRARSGRHSRDDESPGGPSEASGPRSAPPERPAPRGPVLPATAWPIDAAFAGSRHREAPTNGHPANGHDSNGHDSNGHGVNGRGANGRGSADSPGDPLGGGSASEAESHDQGVAHLDTPPYAWPSAPGVPASGPTAHRDAAWTADPGADAESAPDPRPGLGDDAWAVGDVASTVPNGRPVGVPDVPDARAQRPLPQRGESREHRVGNRRFQSDVPPPRRPAGPVDGPDGALEPPSRPPHPRTWPVRVRPGDRVRVDEGGEVVDPPLAPALDAPTEVLPAVDGGVDRGVDGRVEARADEPWDETDPDDRDRHEEDADEGPAGFPGRHRRRAGEAAEERSGTSRRGRSSGSGGGRRGGDGGRDDGGRGGRRRRSSFWKELPILIVVALVLTFLIQTFLAKVYVIPSGSMETTLHGCPGCSNDRVLVDKISYHFADPQPGDVVVFRGPDGWTSEFTADAPGNVVVRALQGLGSLVGLAPPDEKDFIKRVIAVGGQTVKCCDSRNRVLVDDKPLDESYLYFLPEAGSARQDAFGPVTVPAGELWMMGDSRNNSADSRVPGHGPIPIANVIGRARFIVLPPGRFGSIPSPDPQTTAVGMAPRVAAASDAPAALSAVALLPLAVLRRRTRATDEFLPRRRT